MKRDKRAGKKCEKLTRMEPKGPQNPTQQKEPLKEKLFLTFTHVQPLSALNVSPGIRLIMFNLKYIDSTTHHTNATYCALFIALFLSFICTYSYKAAGCTFAEVINGFCLENNI